MKVTEAAQNPSTLFEEAKGGNLAVTSAARKQYLESARGHYLSALAGLNAGKLEQTGIFDGVDASSVLEENAFDQLAEVENAITREQLGQPKTFSEKDIQIQLPKGVFSASEKQLQAIRVQLNKTLARNTNAQIAEMVDRLGTLGKEMNAMDAAELEANRIVPSELGDVKESLSKGVVESRSLQNMVVSLKTELQNLKKEHAELKDDDIGAEFRPRIRHFRLFNSKLENEGCLAKEAKARHTLDEVTHNKKEVEALKIKGKGLKRDYYTSKTSVNIEKRPKVVPDVDETKRASTHDQSKSMPERLYAASVSTSESSARMVISEDELESSGQKSDKLDKLDRGTLNPLTGSIEPDKYDYASEFSIRDYVFSARNKDISMSWPFSQKNLQLCLKHGVKNVLPPFKPMDSSRDSSAKRRLSEKSLPSEESNVDERPSMMKNLLVPGSTMDHCWKQELVEGYRDLDSFPSGGEKDLALKTMAIANSHSEVGSVSTSNLPLSEVSDEREVAASAANKTKSSASQISNKKCRAAVKMHISSSRNTPEDISSACNVPLEAMASKICPVCENFSSSSNTTLNAHIDQCLSSQSTPNRMKNSKLIKPRMKPRKMRLMADICATAPQCTLEDLDRRNGTNWATTVDLPSEDTEVPAEGRSPGVSPRYVVNSHDDDSVYIDSNGRKIRILSKFNDALTSSFPKLREDLRPKKQSKKGKKSKFFSPNRKRRLAKQARHLKYLKVTCQRRRFSAFKLRGSSHEARGAEKSPYALRERNVKRQQPALFVKGPKAQEQKNRSVSGTSSRWISSKIFNFSKKFDPEAITKLCRDDVQSAEDLLVDSDQAVTRRALVKKHSRLLKKPLIQSQFRSPAFDSGVEEQKSWTICSGKKVGSPPPRCAVRGNRDKSGAAKFSGEDPKECVGKSLNTKATSASSPARDEIQPDDVRNVDPGSRNLPEGCHVYQFKGMKSHNLKTDMLSPNPSYVCVCQSTSGQKNSSFEKSCGCSGDEEVEAWSADTSEQSGAKQPSDHCQGGSIDAYRSSEFVDEGQGNYGFVRSSITGHKNREFVTAVSSSSLAIGDTVESLRASLNPKLQKVYDAFDPCSVSQQCSDKIQGPLFRAEAGVNPSQDGPRNEHEMFYGNAAVAERFELKTGDSILNFGHGSSFPEMDPILIPGPPGSDLPSFSDIGSEDLHRTSSSSSSLVPCGDGDTVVDGDSSDSPLSATSTISNLGVADDLTVNNQKPLRITHPVSDNVYAGWSGANSGCALGISSVFSQVTAVESEKATSPVSNSKDSLVCWGRDPPTPKGDNLACCCSRKEGIPWSSALNVQGSQILCPRTASLVSFSGGKHTDSSLTGWPNSQHCGTALFTFNSCPRAESDNLAHSFEASHQSMTSVETSSEALVPFPRASDRESASPAPILRLMGKDLMVTNKEGNDLSRAQAARNVYMDRHFFPVTESMVERSWEYQSPQSSVSVGPLLHEQDPQIFSVQHFDGGSSYIINNLRSPNQTSGGMYINKHLHGDFSVLGPAPLQKITFDALR